MIKNKKNLFCGYALSLTEVSKILKVSTKLVSRLIKTGELEAIKVGREYRIAGSNLDCYIKGKKQCVINVTSNPQG